MKLAALMVIAIVLPAGTMNAHGAAAMVRVCTPAEAAAADHNIPWSADDHRLFTLPSITYARPHADRPGFPVSVLVATDGQIVCLDDPYGSEQKAMKETPERQAVMTAIAGWRFKPYAVDGKPVPAAVTIYVPEKIVFDFHEAMPAPSPDTTVQIDHTECYGRCPSYTLTLHGDGRVDYNGNNYVDVTGAHSFTIPPADVAALIERLRAQDIWSMAGNWASSATDGAYHTITLTVGGQTRVITDYMGYDVGMPQAVSEAEADIDRTGHAAGWINLSGDAVSILEAEHFVFNSQAGADLLARAVNNPDSHDDAAMLRLIELGAPVTGAQPDAYHFLGSSLLDAARAYNRTILIQPLHDRGL